MKVKLYNKWAADDGDAVTMTRGVSVSVCVHPPMPPHHSGQSGAGDGGRRRSDARQMPLHIYQQHPEQKNIDCMH